MKKPLDKNCKGYTVPELKQKLMGETANHRNAFIFGYIGDANITTIDREQEYQEH